MLVKQWAVAADPEPTFLEAFPQYPRLVAKLLYNRGLKNQSDIDLFFHPQYDTIHEPFLLNDMEKAVKRLIRAIDQHEPIICHGDYDADGVTSTAIVYAMLKLLGANVEAFIPHREHDGYGLNMKNIDVFIQQGKKLLITVDCGTTNVKEIARAMEAGLDVIVTDHHAAPPELPPALAILNPKVAGEAYPFKNLSGVGLAYKLMCALLDRYTVPDDRLAPYGGAAGMKKWMLDLVAIGLIADIMPLVGENRTLVRYGLLVLGKTRRLGLRMLAQVTGIDIDAVDSFTIGYQIAPRINAAGRLSHGKEAFQLLTTEDPDEALVLAGQLNEINGRRRSLTDDALAQARDMANNQTDQLVLTVYYEQWVPGIIGLIAGRLCEEWHKPVLVMTKVGDHIVGSGRSLSYFNITESLYAAEDLLLRFGGHHQACGFTITNIDDLAVFQEKINTFATEKLANVDRTPIITVEASLRLEEVTVDLVKLLDAFQPFGEGNPKPHFLVSQLYITAIDRMGDNGKHLKFTVKQMDSPGVKKMLAFNMGNTWGEHLSPGDCIDAIVELGINVWQGRESAELKVVDLRKTNHVTAPALVTNDILEKSKKPVKPYFRY